MQTYFTIKKGNIISSTADEAVIRVFKAPSAEEKQEIIQLLGIESYDFDAALDLDEISRVEFNQEHSSIIWKQPHTGFNLKAQFDSFPVGFFIQKNSLIMIMVDVEDDVPFAEKIFEGVESINDVVLRYFFYTTRQYLSHLKTIKQTTAQIQSKLNSSFENKYLLQMFDISESLVYYIDAIEANGAVLEKLRMSEEKIKLSPKQKAFLDDTIQENTQSSRQAHIYSALLSGLMDARGNIVNNNMNVLLKNLTLVNVIFLPLSILAGMGGMSEFSRLLDKNRFSWELGFLLFGMALMAIGLLLWLVLKKVLYRTKNGKE